MVCLRSGDLRDEIVGKVRGVLGHAMRLADDCRKYYPVLGVRRVRYSVSMCHSGDTARLPDIWAEMVDPVRTSAIVLAASDVNDAIIHIGPKLAVALVLLTAIAAVVNHLSGSGMAAGAVRAVLRAIAQLGALALVVTVVIDVLWASILFVLVMAAVAACTSAGRVTGKPGVIRRETVNTALLCLIPVGLPTLVIVALLVATGVLPMTGLAIIPTAGIMFGAAMNTTSLAGKHCLDSLAERYGEVEAAMSLGFLIREARLEICRHAASTALIPALDQTRSVGLVTIPGSFVGMVLGGASPAAAAAMQLFVLVALLAVSAIASALTAEFIARGLLERPERAR